MLHGVVVNSTITRGRIVSFDTSAALAQPGVVEVITYLNRPKMRSFDLFYKDMTAPGGAPFRPLYDEQVRQQWPAGGAGGGRNVRSGAPCGGAGESPLCGKNRMKRGCSIILSRPHKPKGLKAGYTPPPDEKGHAEQAWQDADCKIDAEYYSGVEHHNPMEMFASTVLRAADGHLTIYDKTQSSQNSRWYVSRVFGLSKSEVTVRNPYVGGAFGSGLRPQYQLPLAVMAALKLQRSVRVVMTRQQMFTFGHRPETWQRVKLAASRDGVLQAIAHEAVAETSRFEDYVEAVVNWSGQLYACENIRLGYNWSTWTSSARWTCARPARRTACMRWKWRWMNCRTRSAWTRWPSA